ncbi:MAG: DUF2116 family Zn-ribbon domain-containing protein [Candidatus Odinarchaeota archaeon]
MAKSYKKQKPESEHLRVPKHSHCELCGAPVRYGMEYCNAEHKKLFEKKARNERLKNAIPVIFVIIIAAASLLISIMMFAPPP